MLFVHWCFALHMCWFAVRCSLRVAVVCCMLRVACCWYVIVACRLSFVVCCSLFVCCCLLIRHCVSSRGLRCIVRCLSFVPPFCALLCVCVLFAAVCCLHVV